MFSFLFGPSHTSQEGVRALFGVFNSRPQLCHWIELIVNLKRSINKFTEKGGFSFNTMHKTENVISTPLLNNGTREKSSKFMLRKITFFFGIAIYFLPDKVVSLAASPVPLSHVVCHILFLWCWSAYCIRWQHVLLQHWSISNLRNTIKGLLTFWRLLFRLFGQNCYYCL